MLTNLYVYVKLIVTMAKKEMPKKRATKKAVKATSKKKPIKKPVKKPASRKTLKKKNDRLKFFVPICVVIVLAMISVYLIVLLATTLRQGVLEDRKQIRLAEAVGFCDSLFDENAAVKTEVSRDELIDCDERLVEIEKDEGREMVLRMQVEDAVNYLDYMQSTEEYFYGEGVVKSSIEEKDLVALDEAMRKISELYLPITSEKLGSMRAEYERMREARNAVSGLFTSEDRKTVRTNTNRNEYNSAKTKVDELRQEDLKTELTEEMARVLPVIEEQERIARELAEKARREREEEQRRIASSWHRLDIAPFYINQHSAGLNNGCEAAALLMALKYKGYARGMDFRSFAAGMPTSENDPNQGFYLSMTDLEPRNEAHWIAPAPLANYGVKSSGAAVVNFSGASLDQLDNEVKNGNPVVIYLTYNFANPKEYSKGVPRNLHVLVLSGFNSYTGEQQFYDPWPVGGANPTISKARTQYLYAASGYRALVVR